MNTIRWLRISYWLGAVTDLIAAAQMLYPPLFGFSMGISPFEPGADYRYAMGMGASLMLGWTALLLWADRKPVERKGVLILTVIPAIACLAANEARGVAAGFVPLSAVLPVWVLQGGLSMLFLVSYWRAGQQAAWPQCNDSRSRGAPSRPSYAATQANKHPSPIFVRWRRRWSRRPS